MAKRSLNRAITVVPSDSVVVSPPFQDLYVGGTGDVKVTTFAGDVVVYKAVPAGAQLTDVNAKLVWATGTTATLMLGKWGA